MLHFQSPLPSVSVGKSQMSHIFSAIPVSFVICQHRGVRICQLCHATLVSFVIRKPRHFLMVMGLTPSFFPHFSWNSALVSEAPSSSGLGDLGEYSACTFTALYLLANQPFYPKELNLQALDFIPAWLWQPIIIHFVVFLKLWKLAVVKRVGMGRGKVRMI